MAIRSERGEEKVVSRGKPAVIPVIAEQTTVDKRVVETGRVRIAKQVREYEEVIDLPHVHEEVHVEHVPVGEMVEAAPEVRTEGDITIIPIVEERYVLQKQLFLREELHVRKERHESHEPQTVKVLKEEVEVERMPPANRRARAANPRQQS